MQFTIQRDSLLKSLTFVQGVVEKKNTLPILSNVLLQAKNNKLVIIATDLDIVFEDLIDKVKIKTEGSTTTSANVLYDILRKIQSGTEISFSLSSDNKVNIKSTNSDFNLLCLPPDNFPTFTDDFKEEKLELDKNKFLSLINKTKISISNDDTRHYLNGIFFHTSESNKSNFLTGVATDSHRLSSCSMPISSAVNFSSLILPKKTVYQLSSLLSESDDKVFLSSSLSKIQFNIGESKLTSKVIDGKFPDYKKVVPVDNSKELVVSTKDFIDSIERVTTVSLDRKEGVKMEISKNQVKLSVNSTNSGEGQEIIKASYSSSDLTISFNSKYLLDIASEINDKNIKINLKDSVSPVLIEDMSDNDSYFVIMPMKV
tara:strand:- start:147 stop:1262 length:1116 start_codon:yes stop_codon:yes gene_type:complete